MSDDLWSNPVLQTRAPFRIERIGVCFELVHAIGPHVDCYPLSLHDVLWLAQDANAAIAALALDAAEARRGRDSPITSAEATIG